jgi:hypothetical protein
MNPPNDLKGNGQEIWDWARRVSTLNENRHQVREIDSQIKEVSSTCGGCDLWMRSTCPRENMPALSGRRVGPCSTDRKCSAFQMKDWASDLVTKLSERRKVLTAEISSLVEGKQ